MSFGQRLGCNWRPIEASIRGWPSSLISSSDSTYSLSYTGYSYLSPTVGRLHFHGIIALEPNHPYILIANMMISNARIRGDVRWRILGNCTPRDQSVINLWPLIADPWETMPDQRDQSGRKFGHGLIPRGAFFFVKLIILVLLLVIHLGNQLEIEELNFESDQWSWRLLLDRFFIFLSCLHSRCCSWTSMHEW